MLNHIRQISYPINAQRYEYEYEVNSSPLGRNDFYKIWLIQSDTRLHFNDRSVYINKPAIFFSNPNVPYGYDILSEQQKGYYCVFKKEYLNILALKENAMGSPIFNADNVDIFFPEPKQLETIINIYNLLINELNTDFSFKEEVVKYYIYLLIYEGLKIQNNKALPSKNSVNRIAYQFLELLERQFPLQSPNQYLKLRMASDYASLLNIHVNSLNKAVKEITGKTTTQHISERILNEAKALLKYSGWNISDIAYALGFSYSNHFDTYFKKREGITPSEYRKINI